MKKVKSNDGLPIVISSDSEDIVYTHTDTKKKQEREKLYENKLHFKSEDEDDRIHTLEQLMHKFEMNTIK